MPRRLLLLAIVAVPFAADGAPAPKIPRDAPWCALPDAAPLFVSPMGEPFRGSRGAPWPSAVWLGAADRNRDGALDRAEFTADADRFFRTLDRDGDGRLAPEEIDRYEREVAPEIALYQARRGPALPDRAARPRAGESGYGGPLGAGEYAWLNVPEPVASTDADVNRVVDRAEFLAAAGRRFDALDRAGEGRLTLAGLGPTPQQAEIEGPCRPRPRPKRRGPADDEGRDDGAQPRGERR